MRLTLSLAALAALMGAAPLPAVATPLDDFNAANLITDFLFDEPQGTAIDGAANSADPAAPFDSADLADFSGAATNGSGQFDGSGKDNTDLATAYTDVDPIDSGRILALYDVTWAFDESVFDPAADEEFRLTLIRDQPRSTFVTAEIFFTRTSATEVELFGNGVGVGALDTDPVTFGSSGSLLTILDVDLDLDVFELFYSADGGATFTSAGTGQTAPGRGVESVRLVLNEDFTDDTILIERFAVAIIPEPAGAAIALAGLAAALLRRRG